jgi:putative hydrolase of the HAD superfamily
MTFTRSDNPPPLAGEGRAGDLAASPPSAGIAENPRIPHLDPPPQAGEEALQMARSLDDIDCWIFDLDNTLYPASCNLFVQIQRRMDEYIAALFGLGLEEAARRRGALFREHGTTLRGLMLRHGIDPHAFLDYVHRIDMTHVPADPALAAALAALPGRKLIFTNGSVAHAENVLGHLGLAAQFEGIFDIAASEWMPKPDPTPYQALIRRFDVVPERAAMVEDMAKNLVPAAALGMTTVWLRGTLDWALEGAEGAHIHHVVDALAPWLAATAARLAPRD